MDREFNYKFGSDLGAGEAGGLRPPAPPYFSGGLRPPDTPKGAPRPWLQRLFAFSRPSHLSGAAALPRADFFLRNPYFLKKPLVWGITYSQKFVFFEEATCPRQLRCLGQNLFSEIQPFC